jgi:hypothetical protein
MVKRARANEVHPPDMDNADATGRYPLAGIDMIN